MRASLPLTQVWITPLKTTLKGVCKQIGLSSLISNYHLQHSTQHARNGFPSLTLGDKGPEPFGWKIAVQRQGADTLTVAKRKSALFCHVVHYNSSCLLEHMHSEWDEPLGTWGRDSTWRPEGTVGTQALAWDKAEWATMQALWAFELMEPSGNLKQLLS